MTFWNPPVQQAVLCGPASVAAALRRQAGCLSARPQMLLLMFVGFTFSKHLASNREKFPLSSGVMSGLRLQLTPRLFVLPGAGRGSRSTPAPSPSFPGRSEALERQASVPVADSRITQKPCSNLNASGHLMLHVSPVINGLLIYVTFNKGSLVAQCSSKLKSSTNSKTKQQRRIPLKD